jgi:hypothetical protein
MSPSPSITETLNVTASSVAIAAVIGEDCGRYLFGDGRPGIVLQRGAWPPGVRLSIGGAELQAKCVELLRNMLPSVCRIAALGYATD